MEEKTAKEIAAQLKRIADALEKGNKIEEIREKRKIKIDKLEEKHLRSELRGSVQPKVSPNLETE
jgi:hypothetical protein